ncbi:MAG TPA: hypothetical protein VMT54_11600 [Candidatus Cybelea sp.]|nr:hypothetical protein [Candidatus Cybelea sp.]
MPDKAYHLARAREHFDAANQATDAAEAATKDPALKGISQAMTLYAAATGEILQAIMDRIERLHQKIDRIEKQLS